MSTIFETDVELAAIARWHAFDAAVSRQLDFYPATTKQAWWVLAVQQNAGDVFAVVGRRATLMQLLEMVDSRDTPMVLAVNNASARRAG